MRSFCTKPASTVIRRVLEIGSGSIKCEVARVDTRTHKICETLFQDSKQNLFINDLRIGNTLRPETIAQGSKIVRLFVEGTACYGVDESAGVATEVFRKADNGAQVVEQLQKDCGVPITIISEHKEARLGFASALGLSDCEQSNLVAWDCGAGSFQLTSHLHTHFDKHGSGTATKHALRAGTNTTNPFDRARLTDLMNFLHNDTKPIPAWLHEPTNHVVAIGSTHSIFNQQRVLSQLDQFSQHDVECTLDELLGLDDATMLEFETARAHRISHRVQYNSVAANTPYIVPKLALLLTVMRKCEINVVKFFQTNGNCAGLLTDCNIWSAKALPTNSA